MGHSSSDNKAILTDMLPCQPDLSNSQTGFPSQGIVGYVKLTIKVNKKIIPRENEVTIIKGC